jgi:cholesterol transport system auxiliary component
LVPLKPHRPAGPLPPVAVWALILALAGCGSAPPLESDRNYSLEPKARETPVEAPDDAVLLVNDLAARGFLGGRQIVYRTREEPLVVERYEHYLWAEPLPRALAQSLVGAIRDAGVFRFVVIPADRARADYLLGGEVAHFEHRPTDQPPRVVATLNLSLVSADRRRSLWTRQYSGEEPVSTATPDAMAEAFNRLTARLVGEVVRDLRTLRPRLKPASGH